MEFSGRSKDTTSTLIADLPTSPYGYDKTGSHDADLHYAAREAGASTDSQLNPFAGKGLNPYANSSLGSSLNRLLNSGADPRINPMPDYEHDRDVYSQVDQIGAHYQKLLQSSLMNGQTVRDNRSNWPVDRPQDTYNQDGNYPGPSYQERSSQDGNSQDRSYQGRSDGGCQGESDQRNNQVRNNPELNYLDRNGQDPNYLARKYQARSYQDSNNSGSGTQNIQGAQAFTGYPDWLEVSPIQTTPNGTYESPRFFQGSTRGHYEQPRLPGSQSWIYYAPTR